MRIKDVRNLVGEYNSRMRDEARRLRFRTITDRSLPNPREKECHNILENDNVFLVATTGIKTRWRIFDQGYKPLFLGTLEECLDWLGTNGK